MIAPGDSDSFATACSSYVVCQGWLCELSVVIKEGAPANWVRDLPLEVAQRVVYVTPEEFEVLDAIRYPVIAYIRGGRLLDCAAGLYSPSEIRMHFEILAKPKQDRHQAIDEDAPVLAIGG